MIPAGLRLTFGQILSRGWSRGVLRAVRPGTVRVGDADDADAGLASIDRRASLYGRKMVRVSRNSRRPLQSAAAAASSSSSLFLVVLVVFFCCYCFLNILF